MELLGRGGCCKESKAKRSTAAAARQMAEAEEAKEAKEAEAAAKKGRRNAASYQIVEKHSCGKGGRPNTTANGYCTISLTT